MYINDNKPNTHSKSIIKGDQLTQGKGPVIEQAPNYYEILGLPPSATTRDIKKACHRLFRQYHPDRGPGNDPEKFRLIKEIYDILTNPEKRKNYDRNLEAEYEPEDTSGHANKLNYLTSIEFRHPSIENDNNISPILKKII